MPTHYSSTGPGTMPTHYSDTVSYLSASFSSPAPFVSSVQTNENVVDSITSFTTASVQSKLILEVRPKFGCSPKIGELNLFCAEQDNKIFCFLIKRVDDVGILNFTKEKSDNIRFIFKKVYMPEAELNDVPGVYCTTDKFVMLKNTDYSDALLGNITFETLTCS
jgi:hypothetical protein